MENVELINFVLKRFQNMVLIMFMFAVHVSQKVGGVLLIVNANVVLVKTVNVWGLVEERVTIIANLIKNHAVGAWMPAKQSVKRERDVETIATKHLQNHSHKAKKGAIATVKYQLPEIKISSVMDMD